MHLIARFARQAARLRIARGWPPPGREAPVPAPPALCDCPLHAAHVMAETGRAAFSCDVSRLVWCNGLGFGPGRWHPFSAAIEEARRTGRRSYRGSVLERYFTVWTPPHARAALIADLKATEALRRAPSYAYVVPWGAESLAQRTARVEAVFRREFRGLFERLPSVDHGFPRHGPLDPAVGEVELRRLLEVTDSIAGRGYRRSGAPDGDILGELLVRGDDYRLVVVVGHHRSAAADALGLGSVPVRLSHPLPIALDHLGAWPMVRAGVWDARDAARYFHHLFDFDSRAWARSRELLAG